jgi:alkanesulfonate monooxygenase SsuD/methylene tetrahydromethanopterin reductase-like flavin-dependent oxidoreductase (luciferase family)
MAVFSQTPWEMMAEELERWRGLYREQHASEPPPPVMADIAVCHAELASAAQLAERHVVGYLTTVMEHYELMGEHFKRAKGYEMYATAGEMMREIGLEALKEQYLGVQAWGDPAQVIDRLRARHELIGDFDLNMCFRHAGIPLEDAANGMKLFAEKVMPEFR